MCNDERECCNYLCKNSEPRIKMGAHRVAIPVPIARARRRRKFESHCKVSNLPRTRAERAIAFFHEIHASGDDYVWNDEAPGRGLEVKTCRFSRRSNETLQ